MQSAEAPKKKLIEVALPLDAINQASAREKSIRHGHPSTLHLWWARRPLAAARAVIFAQMVDDPSSHPELFPTEEDQAAERERLFDIIREMVKWENINNEELLEKARAEIRKYAPDGQPPPLLAPPPDLPADWFSASLATDGVHYPQRARLTDFTASSSGLSSERSNRSRPQNSAR